MFRNLLGLVSSVYTQEHWGKATCPAEVAEVEFGIPLVTVGHALSTTVS